MVISPANPIRFACNQKDQIVRFELEFKNRQTKLVQDYLFHNHLDVFEHKLVCLYFKYSKQVLDLNDHYTNWVLDFQRRSKLLNIENCPLLTSYLKNQVLQLQEEKRLFRFLQFLSFSFNSRS